MKENWDEPTGCDRTYGTGLTEGIRIGGNLGCRPLERHLFPEAGPTLRGMFELGGRRNNVRIGSGSGEDRVKPHRHCVSGTAQQLDLTQGSRASQGRAVSPASWLRYMVDGELGREGV